MTSRTPLSAEAAAFARMVGQASDDELRRLVAARRPEILDALFSAMEALPVPSRTRAVVEWRIGGEGGPVDRIQTVLADGRCVASRDCARTPGLALALDAVDLIRMATAGSTPTALFAAGRLTLEGDLRIGIQLDAWFRTLDLGGPALAPGQAPMY